MIKSYAFPFIMVNFVVKLEPISVPGYEEVYKITEPLSGLLGIIAIHSTQRGPSLGGVRICSYPNFETALEDALRLSKGMTYKALMANAALGGGKAVLMTDPKGFISDDALRAFGRAVNQLEGRYYTAEDSGIVQTQLAIVGEKTGYIVGLEKKGSSGNPCPSTAWGVFRGIQATMHELRQTDSVAGVTVAIQGLGAVGLRLAEILFWHGANLIVTDICKEKVTIAEEKYRATYVPPSEILSTPCDILSPSAYGGILNKNSIKTLACRAVVGCANNQLLEKGDALLLSTRGILYAPDYVVNAGGLINVQFELLESGYDPICARNEIRKIYDRLKEVYRYAKTHDCTTEEAAFFIAEEKLHSHV